MLPRRYGCPGIMTFFFSIFYLQWAINHVVGTQECDDEIHARRKRRGDSMIPAVKVLCIALDSVTDSDCFIALRKAGNGR